jgi:hypothetical protein
MASTLWAQPGQIGAANTARYVGSNRWDWTVYLLADADTLARIRCVEYRLHETFPNPIRQVCQKGSDDQPFALSTQGWGEFMIYVTVMFGGGQQPHSFGYKLKLVETGCANPFDRFTVTEGQTRAIKGVSPPPVYFYAEDIKAKGDLEFRLFRSTRPLPTGNPKPYLDSLKKVHLREGAILDLDKYIKFELSPARGRAEIAVPLSAKETIGIAVSPAPGKKRAVSVEVCR